MNAALQDPVFKDVAELEQALHDDQSGDRARAMMGYFEQAALASEAMAPGAAAAQRQLALDLADGLRASKRIIAHVWQSMHHAALPT